MREHFWIMTSVNLFIADLFNMFWFYCIPHLPGRSKNKHFLLQLQRPNLLFETEMQITVIAISSLWIFVSSFHPLWELFITQIKWSKGILFAPELGLQIIQSIILTNVRLQNRSTYVCWGAKSSHTHPRLSIARWNWSNTTAEAN